MHSDDVWDKDKLALQVAYMEAHEDCGVCLTWALYTDQNLDELRDRIFIIYFYKTGWSRFLWRPQQILRDCSKTWSRSQAGEGLVQSPDHTRLLQIAPSAPITKWISSYCPHITFEQTDLFINGAYYESDVKNIGRGFRHFPFPFMTCMGTG